MSKAIAFESPVGDLEWVFISGEGKENLNGVAQYVTSLVLNEEQAAPLRKLLDDYWAENKPKNIKEPKSMGYYKHTIPTDEKDEEGKVIYEEDGKTLFSFKTNREFADGSVKVVKTFNAKGAEVNLGNKKIGNGSRGRIHGAYGVYQVTDKKKNIVGAGVTLYLNAIQLSKFVEYVGGPSFGALDEEDGDFEGVDEMGGIPDETPTTAGDTSKPRL